ncbi:MAG: hypothetical protein GF405_00100 [Candidatus Eisenbacteria bacterium]|nr:hypothetical protein [Candidatus Eisenbacteria bacterium]
MKRMATILTAAVVLVAMTTSAMGAIGWAGNVWPVNGTPYTSADNIDVYVQVWKDGCTDADPGAACPDIEAYLYYRCSGTADPFDEVPMVYNTDVGNNDEFTGTIPNTHGCSEVEFYVRVVDTTDGDEWYPQDQNNNDPNFFLPITEVLAQDVTVTFTMCLPEGFETSGNVCVVGAGDELGNWSAGVVMDQPCPAVSPKLYQVAITFLAGSNPYREYKYQKDDCATWESTGNRSITIDDSSPTMELDVDGWEYNTPDCPDCTSPVEEASWGVIKALYK